MLSRRSPDATITCAAPMDAGAPDVSPAPPIPVRAEQTSPLAGLRRTCALLSLCLLVTLPACEAPRPPATGDASAAPSRASLAAAKQLLDSAPAEWPDAIAAWRAQRGDPQSEEGWQDATNGLATTLQTQQDARGCQAALGLLGRHGDARSAAWLVSWIRQRRPHCAEAALALGQIPSALETAGVTTVLHDLVGDTKAASIDRTAAAIALFDMQQDAVAAPFLHAILIAGTPSGRARAADFGIADKSRWALERKMVIAAIARRNGGEAFGLDPENPWPTLVQGAHRFLEAFSPAEPPPAKQQRNR